MGIFELLSGFQLRAFGSTKGDIVRKFSSFSTISPLDLLSVRYEKELFLAKDKAQKKAVNLNPSPSKYLLSSV
jgi:hypothetical protein